VCGFALALVVFNKRLALTILLLSYGHALSNEKYFTFYTTKQVDNKEERKKDFSV